MTTVVSRHRHDTDDDGHENPGQCQGERLAGELRVFSATGL